MIWNEILCLGDSITFGARDPYKRSYPNELGQMLTEKTKEFYFCHNCSISGETSSELLRRAWGNIKSHSNANIMLLIIGTNKKSNGKFDIGENAQFVLKNNICPTILYKHNNF